MLQNKIKQTALNKTSLTLTNISTYVVKDSNQSWVNPYAEMSIGGTLKDEVMKRDKLVLVITINTDNMIEPLLH